jgi:hypothetical protein
MPTAKKPKYSGLLNEPILYPFSLDTFSHGTQDPEREQTVWLADQYRKRMLALYDHYGIKLGFDSEWSLIWALANDHVPGFKVIQEPKRKRGRPNLDPGPLRDIELCCNVLAIMQGPPSRTVVHACRVLAKRDRSTAVAASTLRRRYYAAMRNRAFSVVVRKAVAYGCQFPGSAAIRRE